MTIRLLLLAAFAQLAGCTAMSGFPRPVLDPRAEDAELAPYVGAEAMARYEACADRVACRNTLIDARLRAVDLAFYRFQRKVYGQEARVSLGSDVLAMMLDSVATVTATRPLAVGSGLVSGGREAYRTQVLSVSLPLLFEEMTARRRELLLRIRQGQQMPTTTYSLFQALGDISEYEQAGSIPAAAAELGANAGAAARSAQARLDALRAQSFAAAPPIAAAAPVAVTAPVETTAAFAAPMSVAGYQPGPPPATAPAPAPTPAP